ncbi:unnamed protein product [Nyctereutes procyonoides]|uniref:(raccoon dog) hypothetical protein n=1 Tax=Nyctereutes procyonoides TaxID=34880 RepID=A0A811Z6Y6_NYCPR|nr:unnamed protein product [Nyctereutes procyonoides]
MQDDAVYENDDVKEAIRLPENLPESHRMFHIKRWTKYEEGKFYLEPYLTEVIRERKQKNGQRSNHRVEICGYSCPQIFLRNLSESEMYN